MFGRTGDGITGYCMYFFILIGFFVAYHLAVDTGFVPDNGAFWNGIYSAVVSVFALITYMVLSRNMKNKGGSGGRYRESY